MKGTKKQIDYAKDIIEAVETAWEASISQRANESYIEKYKELAAKRIAQMKAIENAAEVIESKATLYSKIRTAVSLAKKGSK